MNIRMFLLLVLALATLSIISCTLIGLGVGTAIDAKNAETIELDGWQAVKVDHGDQIEVVLQDGRVLKGRYLRHTPDQNQEVVQQSIRFDPQHPLSAPNFLIPVDQIQTVTITKEKSAKFIGLFLGAAIDVGIIIAASKSSSDEPSSSAYTYSSCPLVYACSSNGKVLDAEPFSGAIYQAAQFTDWDRLDHLQVTDQAYRLHITNQPRETQYIDQMQLQVVTHPIGTTVWPSRNGDMIVVAEEHPPVVAVSDEGNHVVNLLKEQDDQVWLSNPFNRDPEFVSDLRSELILEFTKPANAGQAHLLFTVRNTNWASCVQERFLTLFGHELENWYNQLNASQNLHDAFTALKVREGMVLISVWDGDTWQEQGHIWEVGTAVNKDLAFRLDIPSMTTDRLKVKLEYPPGIWILDYVAMSFSDNSAYTVHPLIPEEAKDHAGKDVRQQISAVDKDYLVLDDRAAYFTMTCPAPEFNDGFEHTMILQSNGYYTIHVDASGQPQTALIERIQTEPYFLMKMALESLHAQVREAL